jgi:hypothetical protein
MAGIVRAGHRKLGLRFRQRIKAEVWDKDGKLLQRAIGYKNDVYERFKYFALEATMMGKCQCARVLRIKDTTAGFGQPVTATLKGGTGDGTVPLFTKIGAFNNTTLITYSINKVTLEDYVAEEYCEYTFAPALSYPPGAVITVEYEVTFADDSVGAGYEGTIDTDWINELAKGFGQDADNYNMVCAGMHGGSIKIYYTQGGNPFDMTEDCNYSSRSLPTNTTDGYYVYLSDLFSHATHNAATITKIEFIPSTPGGGVLLVLEDNDLGGVSMPVDFTAGYVHTLRFWTGE